VLTIPGFVDSATLTAKCMLLQGIVSMKLLRIDKYVSARVTDPMFLGKVLRQGLTDGLSEQVRVAVVEFQDGARNTLHTHNRDQVLIITEGEGVVATETEEHLVTVGDVIFIPAGEQHWHGAQPRHSMTHLAIIESR
jgi:quercetin dioxygenase-like cupin family protein